VEFTTPDIASASARDRGSDAQSRENAHPLTLTSIIENAGLEFEGETQQTKTRRTRMV